VRARAAIPSSPAPAGNQKKGPEGDRHRRTWGFICSSKGGVVKISANGTEVDEVLLHKFSPDEKADAIGLRSGNANTYTDVENSIVGGDKVFLVPGQQHQGSTQRAIEFA
jgi:hypothetical protein